MKLSQQIALEKLRRYCAYQDRCHKEVRDKLITLKVYGDDLEEIIIDLIKDDFLNEERFARPYARGKFRNNLWGRIKIKHQLKQRYISNYCIRKAMEEIDPEVYLNTLSDIIMRQMSKHADTSTLIAQDKAIKYAVRRGYESPLIFKIIKGLEDERR